MKITLPSLGSTLYQKTGSKNIVRQFISLKAINISKFIRGKSLLFSEDRGNKICLTSKEEYITKGMEYALLTNVLSSKQRFEEDK